MRIAIVLECPPPPGDYTLPLLDKMLAQAGIRREECTLLTVLPTYHPAPERVKWTEVDVAPLHAALTAATPTLILAFDRSGLVLRALSGEKRGIDDWRGFVWAGPGGVPVLATYAPARVKVEWGLTGVVKFDLEKGLRVGREGVNPPVRRIRVCMPDYNLDSH